VGFTALEVVSSDRVIRLFMIEVTLDETLGNWYNLSKTICGLVVRVPGYRSRGPGSIPGATRQRHEYN
jgi:hypothetical protein